MSNIAQLTRRQSSRELKTRKSCDKLEMKDLQGKLINESDNEMTKYGITNVTFEEDLSVQTGRCDLRSDDVLQDKLVEPGDEIERESWDSKLQFLLATVGYAVGLGNIWRFPYLAQKNGGGAFLIPYFIMLFIEGIPIFYLELAIGQRLRKGAIGVWNQVSPYLGGIGIASSIVSFNVSLYYNTIIAWCLYYLFQSFRSPLPWAACPNHYFDNGSYTVDQECEKSSPTQYFWYRNALNISKNVSSPDSFNWWIMLCLLMAWTLVYLCMLKGIASSGKVVYITSTFPYVVLIIFFFRGMTLEGKTDGILHLFVPTWDKLLDPVVWLEAGTQIFFSLGLAFGGLIAFSSYNPITSDCFKDAIIVSLINCFTSLFAAIVVFSVLGFKAHLTHIKCLEDRNASLTYLLNMQVNYSTEIPQCNLQEELANSVSGTGLAFIMFCEAINQFPSVQQLWSLLFFLMLFTLGIDSQFGTLEGVITSIVDMKIFPNVRKEILTGVLCFVSFLLSIMFAHGGGNYIFILFDDFSGSIPLLIIAFFECIAVAYVYGLKRFADDIKMMTGRRPSLYWLLCWRYISPATMIAILTASFLKMAISGSGYLAWKAETGKTEHLEWPVWCLVAIAILVLMPTLWIPGIALSRWLGYYVMNDEQSSWFPVEDLKDYRKMENHTPTNAEKNTLRV